jgi:hypothetical protein
VKAMAYVSDMARGENKVVEEGFLRQTSYHLNGLENYVRIEITDWEGRKAWTNPIYIKSQNSL